ncbi:MAG TPA: hypothetical protein VHX60_14110 [Acidobacteriaceae bacterium]|jgi:hypothetical protein|nr:hypothetical protein [Acidobacteriaceae bacterium]
MSLAAVQMTLRIGYAWMSFNLATTALLAVMYSLHLSRRAIQQRRSLKARRLAPVVCIARR